MPLPLSILDLATVSRDVGVAESIAASVQLAQRAEDWGYTRYWFAEHHNMPSIASSATSVLIGHVAQQTSRIRVGSGGIMLPNHSPLVIAEQFGTLATMFPGRIDLGLGRAPGGDSAMLRALRRDHAAAEQFPQDVLELQALLGPAQPDQAVRAIPGEGTQVPLFILGSSLFGAQLAAAIGLPYAFASHFAPDALEQAVAIYRRDYQPSLEHPEPHVITAMNVYAADSSEQARHLFDTTLRHRLVSRLSAKRELTNEEIDLVLESPQGAQFRRMMHYSAVGSPDEVRAQVEEFASHSDADEVIVATHASPAERLRSYELLAQAWGLGG